MFRLAAHALGDLPEIRPRAARWDHNLDAALVAPSAETLAALHRPDALVVTTGQQPGLFGGPVYSIHKGLAAASLAAELSRRWNRPVVALFWVAGDDHDFDEARHATWLDNDGELVTWSLPERDRTAPQRPLTQELLPASIVDGIARIARSLPSGEPREAVIAALHQDWSVGRSLHSAFTAGLARQLAPYGVVCFDPTHSAVKLAQRPWLLHALRRAGEIERQLAELPDADTGIRTGGGATLVFLVTDLGRERLMVDGSGFRTRRSGQHFTLAELERLLDAQPERFSANVLLRPVVEAGLLPTVAYVAGPGEMRYLTRQVNTLYPEFDTARQAPVPRWSGTTIPHWAERLLDRLQLHADQVIGDDGTLARVLLGRDFPPEARRALDALRRQIQQSGVVIAESGTRIDPVLDRATRNRLKRMTEIADDTQKVIERHLRRRSDIAHAQFQRLRTALLPNGEPQERVLNAITFLGRYGDEWLVALRAATDRWAATLPDPGA